MGTKAVRSGKAIGGGKLWRMMRGNECVGTIVHSTITGLWFATPASNWASFSTHETQAEALAVFGVA